MSCEIVIDTPGPFYSGSLIQGKLLCSFNSREKIRGIKIRAYGDEHTEWWGTESYYNETEKRTETRSILYTGDNNLFSLEIMLFGGHGDTHVGPGMFTYPFSFQLPANLPSTFDNSYGHIRYTLKGIIDIPWGMDYEDKVHMVVLSLIDLNNFPVECFQPTSRSDEKTVCCWCCAGGDITVSINLSKSAFVPGDKIKLYVALTNMSNTNVDELEAKFIQYVRSHVHLPSGDSKTEQFTLASDTWSGVGAHGENKYDIEIPIPLEMSVPNLDRSALFEVNYDIQITAGISGCHSDIDLSFSVNLGHIQHQSQMSGPTAPGGFVPQNYPPPQEGNGYPNASGGGAPGGGYPYPAGGQQNAPPGGGGYPSGPYPSAPGAPYPPGAGSPFMTAPAAPYPPTGPGFAVPGASAPMAPYSSDPPNYSSLSQKPPYNPGNTKEKEASELINIGGVPSAPPTELPPPSYADIAKKN